MSEGKPNQTKQQLFFFFPCGLFKVKSHWWNHYSFQVNILHGITFSEEHSTAWLLRKLVLYWQSYEHLELLTEHTHNRAFVKSNWEPTK